MPKNVSRKHASIRPNTTQIRHRYDPKRLPPLKLRRAGKYGSRGCFEFYPRGDPRKRNPAFGGVSFFDVASRFVEFTGLTTNAELSKAILNYMMTDASIESTLVASDKHKVITAVYSLIIS